MGYLEGFGITIRKWLAPTSDTGRRVTLQYPEQTRPKPERFHGRHVLNRYDDGMEKCIGCELCAGVCPARCIYVRGADNDPDAPTSPGERYGFVYEINYLRCIHCDLCVEACPTEAITETKLFEFAFTNRDDAIYTKAELVVGDDGRPRQLPWENWDGGFDPAADTSGWMRATAPAGDADFVGLVAWAGELGYGTRAPEGGGRVDAAVAPPLEAPPEPEVHEPEVHEVEPEPVAEVSEPAELQLAEPAVDAGPAVAEASAAPATFDAPSTPEPRIDEPAPPTPAPRQTAGLFDAPEGVAARRPEPPAPAVQEDPDVQDAQVAAEVARELDAAPDEVETGDGSNDAGDADDTDGTDDDGVPEPPAPRAPIPSGPGFFDLPDPEPSPEPEPKRRRKGWGRR